MKIVCAIDSFKGSLSSGRAAELAKEEAGRIVPESICIDFIVADGGEGTAEAAVAASGGEFRHSVAQDPLGRPIEASYGVLPGNAAIIEMAAASGLPLLSEEELDPLRTTSYGTGQLIADALDHGARTIAIALGGSATNDAGTGLLEALGVRFLDAAGNALKGNGENLEKIDAIVASGLDPRVAQTDFVVLCDVSNPLVGENGATMTFGRQKGASDAELQRLEQGMRSYLGVLQRCSIVGDEMPGDGAAGGAGMAARAFLHAKQASGADWVLDAIGLERVLEDTDLCITGEGHADGQSVNGKLVSRIARRCKKSGVPCVAIVGGMDESAVGLEACGVDAIFPSVIDCCSKEDAMRNAERNFRLAVDRVLIAVNVGRKVGVAENSCDMKHGV